jgi:MHS family alpha-ketoglutarate permease-like MFS transporter
MSETALEAWGWRIPFAVGGVLAVVVFWLRRRLAETESFTKSQARGAQDPAAHASSLTALLRQHPREFVTVLLLTAGGTLAFYAYSIYMQKFLANSAGFSRQTATWISAGTLFVFMCMQPLAGALSDRVGRKPLMVGFGIAGVIFTWPIFWALEHTGSAAVAFAIVLFALVIVTGYTSINAVVKAELFPAHIRALGVAFPYAVANALFGGTAEAIALKFKQAGWEQGFYWYLTAMIAVSLVTYLRMPDTRATSRISED